MFAAIKDFFVAPATLDMPTMMIRLTTGPKKPMIVYPTMGAAARRVQADFQMIAQPAMTGRAQRTSWMIRMLRMRDDKKPVRRMKMSTMPPRGNCQRMESRVVHPKVETISGPKPDTAPLTVYLTQRLVGSERDDQGVQF